MDIESFSLFYLLSKLSAFILLFFNFFIVVNLIHDLSSM